MKIDLANHLAVIAGGAQGIGWATAKAFQDCDAKVVVIDQKSDQLAGSDLSSASADVRAFKADLREYGQVESIAEELVGDEFDRLHLVNCVAVSSGSYGFPFWNVAPQQWGRVLDVNVVGAVNLLHAFVPILLQHPKSSVAMVTSVAGQIGSQTDPPYSASKAALINFSQVAARDLAEYDVRVNSVSPGMVQTELNESVWRAWNEGLPAEQQRDYATWAAEKIERIAPLGRWQTPEDIANMIVFLASDLAGNVTGQTLNVDGGQVMHS